jgi:hypothetical protein
MTLKQNLDIVMIQFYGKLMFVEVSLLIKLTMDFQLIQYV